MKKTLIDIINEFSLFNGDHTNGTDKEFVHKFISMFYQESFCEIQENEIKLLEIGTCTGASLKMWKEFFMNGKIEGVDVQDRRIHKYIDNKIVYHHQNAYDANFVSSLAGDYNIIIDDGPHTIDTQINFIDLYYDKIKSNGFMIIEDVDSDINIMRISEKFIEKGVKPIVIDNRVSVGLSNEVIVYIKK